MAADDNSPLQLWLRPRPPDNRCPSPSPSSSSSSSVSPTSSSSISSRHRQMSAQCAATAAPMTDLDAARALADFAHMALLERSDAAERGARRSSSTRKRAGYNEAGDVGEAAGTSGGGGGGTAGQRIDGKAQEGGGRNHRHGTRPLALDLNQNAISSPSEEQQLQTATSGSTPEEQQHHNLGLNPFSDQPLKVEHAGGVRLPFGAAAAARPKQSISEAEKEAKRLRRVLANRESARQTIRRRQALREELTRKADSLSQENETMKKEKEFMMKEFKLLKEINSRLKEMMEERLQHEAENPQPPLHAPAAEDPPPQPFPTQSGRHSVAAAAAPLLHQQQQRFPPLVPFPWPQPHLQLVSPFSLVKFETNSKNVNLGCCYDQGVAQVAASALYVPPAAAYPAMFHPQLAIMHQDQPLFGNACAVEEVGENPHRSPPVDTTGGDSSRTLIPPEPAKAKAKAVVEEPPRCGRTTAVYTEPKAKAKAPLDRSNGKVFPLVVPEASSSSAKNEKQTANYTNPEKTPWLFGTATGTSTEQNRKHHHHHHKPSLPPVLNDEAVPIHSILPQDAVVTTRENHNLPDRGAANDEAADRRQNESQEHLLKKAMDATAARKRRRELTKLKHQYHQQRWKI